MCENTKKGLSSGLYRKKERDVCLCVRIRPMMERRGWKNEREWGGVGKGEVSERIENGRNSLFFLFFSSFF